ncbi:hypothetical protein SK128_014908 [Halocaridina rubra]|uniref:Uncharacterized protein n=1 Tax=Halocaridina rubra TaxID=373956 RepID=A0AAN9A465_HALRR
MFRAKGFCDLNIEAENSNLKESVLKALSLGYQTIAINQNVTLPSLEKSGSKKRKGAEEGNGSIVPVPVTVNLSSADLKRYKITREPVILTRITISYTDPSSPYLLKSADAIRQYDLIAFVPENDATLKQVMTGKIDVDIISLIPNSATYQLSRSLLKSSMERDVYFEIPYSPCITDVHARKQIIMLSHFLHRTCKSSNIIITSKAKCPTHLRYPYDVINICQFLGLSEIASKAAIGTMAHNAVYCASARRRGVSKCAVQITVSPDADECKKFVGIESAEEYMKSYKTGKRKLSEKCKAKKKKIKVDKSNEVDDSGVIKF